MSIHIYKPVEVEGTALIVPSALFERNPKGNIKIFCQFTANLFRSAWHLYISTYSGHPKSLVLSLSPTDQELFALERFDNMLCAYNGVEAKLTKSNLVHSRSRAWNLRNHAVYHCPNSTESST